MLGVLGLGPVGLQIQAPGHRLEHDALLGHRERGAEAAAGAAAEGQPLVGPGLVAEPALRPERERVGIQVVAVVERAGCSC